MLTIIYHRLCYHPIIVDEMEIPPDRCSAYSMDSYFYPSQADRGHGVKSHKQSISNNTPVAQTQTM